MAKFTLKRKKKTTTTAKTHLLLSFSLFLHFYLSLAPSPPYTFNRYFSLISYLYLEHFISVCFRVFFKNIFFLIVFLSCKANLFQGWCCSQLLSSFSGRAPTKTNKHRATERDSNLGSTMLSPCCLQQSQACSLYVKVFTLRAFFWQSVQ